MSRQRAIDANRKVAGYVQELRKGGMSYGAIATRLNSEGHTTRRGKSWRSMQVKRVLERVSVGL